jgi:hypothetical protein
MVLILLLGTFHIACEYVPICPLNCILTIQSPKNEIVRGLQSALASLGPIASLRAHPLLLKTGPSTLCMQMGVKSCPAPQHDLPPSGSVPSSDPGDSEQLGKSGSETRKDEEALQVNSHKVRQSPTTCLQSTKKKNRNRLLACPVKKNSELHHDTSPCQHAGSDSMSDLRKHLNTRVHRDSYPFIDLCRACGEYIVNDTVWRELHITKQCIQQTGETRKQIRGSRVAEQWKRLYGRMFPQSELIPSPCMCAYSILMMRLLTPIVVVDDSTSSPKASLSRLVQLEPSVQNGGLNFNFNDPRSILPSSQEGPFRQNFATSYPTPAPIGDNSGQTTSWAIFESLPTDNLIQNPAIEHQSSSYSPAFLDYSLVTALNELPLGSGLFRTPVPNNGIPATDSSHSHSHDDGFSFSYSDILDLENAGPEQERTGADTGFHNHDVQPDFQDHTSDRSRTAAQQFIYEQLEEIARNTDAEGSATLAQRISHINGVSFAGCELLYHELMARISALAEQPHTSSTSGVEIAASFAAFSSITPTTNEMPRAGTHSVSSPPLLNDPPLIPLGPWEDDLCNPATLDNMGTAYWDAPPDPTYRSFFPELDLTLPYIVPT